MAIFSPDFVDPTDDIGFGYWLNAHALEHDQFVRIGFANTPIFIFPQYDLFSWYGKDQTARRSWLEVHEEIHAQLRSATNVQGFNLADVEWDNPEYRLIWMDSHAFEHAQIRKVLGIN
jgi:hypothetical protein